MRSSARFSSTATAAIATLALGVAAVAASAPAQADSGLDHTGKLTAQARKAGLTEAGGGQMGWRSHLSKASASARPSAAELAATTPGIDVSSYQGSVNWASYYSDGKRFAYVKATEGTSYISSTFTQQYNGSYNAGFIRGAYHFAHPDGASGASQASYFVSHGGGWSKDGKTLPGALDIEYNPNGATCYGLSQSAMVSWIKSFTTKYKSLTGRDAVIYSTTDWWTQCTGNSSAFANSNPLWIARYSSSVGTLPAGWGYYTIWQYSSSPLDQDRFNGSTTQLKALANG